MKNAADNTFGDVVVILTGCLLTGAGAFMFRTGLGVATRGVNDLLRRFGK